MTTHSHCAWTNEGGHVKINVKSLSKPHNNWQMTKFMFATYGDDLYRSQASRIARQANSTKCFSEIYIYNQKSSEAIVNGIYAVQEASKSIESAQKRHGFWIWKILLIEDMLSKMNSGDILMYADSGCTLNVINKERLRLVLDILSKSKIMGLFYELHRYTCTDICDPTLVDLVVGSKASLNATVAGYFFLKKTDITLMLINKWKAIALSDGCKHLIGLYKKQKCLHYHDQSILSILLTTSTFRNNYIFLADEGWPLNKKNFSFISATRSRGIVACMLRMYLKLLHASSIIAKSISRPHP